MSTEGFDTVFEALDEYTQLQRQGQAPSPEEYVKNYSEALRAELLATLLQLPGDAEREQAWNKIQTTLYPEKKN